VTSNPEPIMMETENASAGDRLLDRELDVLPQELRWREWMNRVEAVIFASGSVAQREELLRVIGVEANLDMLIEDIQAELKGRPYELVAVGGGWMHRTRAQYSDAIHAAADTGEKNIDLNEAEMAVLCAIAYHQPLSRDGLKDMFGKEISRDLLNRLRFKGLIGNGPKSPRRGAPHTYVTTPEFLALFDMQSLRELPEI
jgi:segregation and condensation protein B